MQPTYSVDPSMERAGEERTKFPRVDVHRTLPVAPTKAYMRWLSFPTYTVPSGPTAADDLKNADVGYFQFSAPLGFKQ